MNTEPVTRTEAIRLAIVAVLAALPLFSPWQLTEAQSAAILALYGAISIVLAAFTRARVVPVPVVDEIATRRARRPEPLPGGVVAPVTAGEYQTAHAAVERRKAA
jgi:hypothetical protein